jgi:mRNA interferase MazF
MFGEIHICQFPFTSGELSKPRPVLVLFDLYPDVLICRVTSVLRTGPLDVMLADWKAEGLALPSVARLDRIVTAERTLVKRQIGMLSAADERAVRDAWNEHMRL